jgi:hypothetical protein
VSSLRLAVALPVLPVGALAILPPGLHADGQERLKVGRQPAGRVVVPSNQILRPAGQQVLFPGRPVDLALADGGKTLIVKNLKDLVVIDVTTGTIRQTLPSPVGFSVVGLLPRGERILVTDAKEPSRNDFGERGA